MPMEVELHSGGDAPRYGARAPMATPGDMSSVLGVSNSHAGRHELTFFGDEPGERGGPEDMAHPRGRIRRLFGLREPQCPH